MEISKYLISEKCSVLECLQQINQLRTDMNLFVVNEKNKLLGSVTDGDIRRGILKGIGLDEKVARVMNASCKHLVQRQIDLHLIIEQRNKFIKILPITNDEHEVVALLNFNQVKTLLPVDAVIMAGGTGSRLLPLTQKVPKPLLPVGGKPIIAYNLERLQKFGVKHITITVNYLKEQLVKFVEDLGENGRHMKCVTESKPLGTMGAVSLIDQWHNDYILLTNSDLLTNVDYEDFFLEFLKSKASMMVATIPYPIQVPYAILETDGSTIKAFKEKPEYTYYANTGIYLFKRELISYIPKNKFFNATDFMDRLLIEGHKLSYYPMTGYWLDIGKHEDFKKAKEDIKHLKF